MRPVGSKYLLEEPLGRGATGTVWRACVRVIDPDATTTGGATVNSATLGAAGAQTVADPGEKVAIKVLREELANDSDVVMRFLRERSVLLRLTHPNIVRVRDLVVEGELLALVMDLVEGPDLHRYLKENGRFSPAAGALLMAQVADALAASHADGVVHRDLKPANVLLATLPGRNGAGETAHPMLTDFGIARLADSPGITRTHEFVGTPAYVAPETAEGRPQTSAVDVYGAGIMLYELVTGRPPFEGDGPLQILQAHLTQEPRRPTSVPEPLWVVIERCLRKAPDERPSAVALSGALRTVAAGIGVHASPEAIYAAERVVALLTPDPSPAAVPGTGAKPEDPTVPRGVQAPQHDPSAATMVAGAAAAAGLAAGAAEAATEVFPAEGRGDDRTQVLPPAGGGASAVSGASAASAASAAGTHHPWETQLKAARTRNEQTEVAYLPPEAGAAGPPPRVAPAPYRPPAPGPAQAAAPAPVRRAPDPWAPPREPEPQRRPRREPDWDRPRREPRRRRRMRIPGAGCLRTLLMLVLIAALVWYFTPLHHWIDNVVHWWNGLVGAVNHVRHSIPHLPKVNGG